MALKFSTITQSVTIGSTPNKVYDALMDSKSHAAITGSPAKMSGVVGGRFTAWDGYIIGKNLELVRGKKIVQEWSTTEWPGGYPPSRLEITLAKSKEGTILKMVHSKVPAEQRADYAEGWRSYYWKPLKAYFSEDA
jgi:activator of HSP90 ATPase